MVVALPDSIEPVIPTAEAAAAAGASLRDLARFRASHGLRKVSLSLDLEGGQDASVPIPAAVLELLQGILVQMAQGNAVTLVPVHAELAALPDRAAGARGNSLPQSRHPPAHPPVRSDDLQARHRPAACRGTG